MSGFGQDLLYALFLLAICWHLAEGWFSFDCADDDSGLGNDRATRLKTTKLRKDSPQTGLLTLGPLHEKTNERSSL